MAFADCADTLIVIQSSTLSLTPPLLAGTVHVLPKNYCPYSVFRYGGEVFEGRAERSSRLVGGIRGGGSPASVLQVQMVLFLVLRSMSRSQSKAGLSYPDCIKMH